MLVFVAFAVLCALTLVVLLRPLFAAPIEPERSADEAVYAAQLAELEADVERGAIAADDASAARTEIARRLLRANRAHRPARLAGGRLVPIVSVLVFVPAFTLAAYLYLGNPSYGDRPLAARLEPVTPERLDVLVARAEAALADNPDDRAGWEAIAPVYHRLGRFDDAATAFRRARELGGDPAALLTGEAEALTFAAEGIVTEDARALLDEALEREPDAVRPRIYLAIAARQDGDYTAASERWRALIEESDGTEPWLDVAAAEFQRMGDGSPAAPGPAASQSAAAPDSAPDSFAPPAAAAAAIAALPEGERGEMIEAMVERLATRLERDGGTAEEWARLVRSYEALGRQAEAQLAREEALAALDGEARSAFERAVPQQEGSPQ